MGAGPKKCSQPQTPGPQPFLYGRELGPASESILIERKSTKPPGAPRGEPPWHVFAFFLRVKKEGGPQAKPEKDGYGGLSAYTMRLYFKRAHAIKHDLCFGTLFLVDKKAGSNAVEIIRGLPRPSQKLPHLPEASSRNRERSVRGHSP